MQGRRTKAQKDKPEGPSHPAGALACSRSPPSQGASQDPLDKPPPSLTGGGLGGELLPVVCYEIVPKLLKQRRSSQLQQRKTQTMTAPPLNKEERHYS